MSTHLIKKKYLFLIVLFLSFVGNGLAQKRSIIGEVMDTVAQTPLPNAIAVLIRLSDSTIVKFSRTDDKGMFKMESIPVDTYIVVISHVRFSDMTFIFIPDGKESVLNFGKIILPTKVNLLNEIVVYDYSDKGYYKGDTLQFNPDSFKLRQNATIEDLLKKLPGVKVSKNGKIVIQGKQVDQVLIDGDEFFGSDPTIITKNLSPSAIETIQVYDKKQEGAETDKTLKIVNLKLKDGVKKGHFGKVSGGTDFNQFYENELLVNQFKNQRKVSVFSLYSNTPKQAFIDSDADEYG